MTTSHTNEEDWIEEFDKLGLGKVEWCGNEDHECECGVKEYAIKDFIRNLAPSTGNVYVVWR